MRLDSKTGNNWIAVKAIGVKSNRSGIGARIKCSTSDRTQFDDVRSGGSYYSQNDLRVHFGLGKAATVAAVEVRWPSGIVDTLRDLPVNQTIVVREGEGLVTLPAAKTREKEIK